ncbi:MAG: SDR family oxidoreductase [Victivallaceae bacterium]|nr:SDR family oxidoreductase [Victivallaceae bacterium]
MKGRLEGKICAITGAGRGIGRVAAELFAAERAKVFILELDETSGKAAEKQIRVNGSLAHYIKCDVSCYDSVQNAFRQIEENTGKLDVLFNNASVYLAGKDKKISDIEPAIWSKVLNINLNSIYHCCRFAIPLLRKSGGGSIINTASSAAITGIPKCDAYTASKGATVALSRSMAVEYGPENIRVNCIAPAAIATDMVKQSNPDGDDFDTSAFINLRTPLRRWGKPDEVAKLALFLASDESSYINGTVIAADGGITISGDLSKPTPRTLQPHKKYQRYSKKGFAKRNVMAMEQ